jgi:hypothetical protein
MQGQSRAGPDAALEGAVAVDGVPDLVGWILRVPDLTGAEVLAGAGVFSGEGALGAGCSGAAGAVWLAEAGSGIVWTSGTAGPFPLRSMPALAWLAPTSSVVPAPLAGTPESEASC